MRKIILLSMLLSLSLGLCAQTKRYTASKARTASASQAERKVLGKHMLSITFLVSCRNGKDTSDDDVKLTHESKYVKDKGDIVSIDINELIDKRDTLDACEIIGANYALVDTLRIEMKSDAEIVRAEKVTCYYPTVWSEPDDEAIQCLYLFNLGFVDVMPLNLNKGIVEYPLEGLYSEKDAVDFLSQYAKESPS